jgi:hypothetical protein
LHTVLPGIQYSSVSLFVFSDEVIMQDRTLNKAVAASLLIFGLTSSALADEQIDPAGTWTLRASRPGRPAQESTLKLEKNGDQLVGVIKDAQGRTGTIKDAQIKDNDITFRVEVERDGQKFNFIYKGKLSKDAMKGTVLAKILGQQLTFDFDGKRAKENATLSGSWKLSLGGPQRAQQGGGARPQGAGGRGRPGGGRPGMPQMMLNLREEGGKVSGDFIGFGGKATPIQDATLKDGELTFKVPQEMGPNKVTIEFVGKLAGDKLQGTAKIPLPQGTRSLGFQGERQKAATANAGGTWKLKVALKDGPTLEPTLKLTQTGTTLKGAYVGEQGETPISNALIFGEEITFDVNRERDGKKYRLHYQGKVKGDALIGSVDYDFDGIIGFVDFKGERVSASTASSDKTH